MSALCGWSPPAQRADTATKRSLDRVLLMPGAWCAVVLIVIALFNVAGHIPTRGAVALDGFAALLAGGMCVANLYRCRHAHCLITSAGWLSLGIIALAGAAAGHSLIGGREQTVFGVTFALALAFELVWYLGRGTNALR